VKVYVCLLVIYLATIFGAAVEYIITEFQEKYKGLNLNGKFHLRMYADINLFGRPILPYGGRSVGIVRLRTEGHGVCSL
jgi:hypothetical protein